MDYIVIFKAAHHVYYGIHFPDVAQELVAQAFSFGSPFYQTGDIHEFNDCGSYLFGMVHISQKLQPFVRNRYDSHIGIYGAEGVVGGFRARFRQGN